MRRYRFYLEKKKDIGHFYIYFSHFIHPLTDRFLASGERGSLLETLQRTSMPLVAPW